jgi:superoxide reductase
MWLVYVTCHSATSQEFVLAVMIREFGRGRSRNNRLFPLPAFNFFKTWYGLYEMEASCGRRRQSRTQTQEDLEMGTEVGEVYKCEICGNVVKVLENGSGDLVCCGEEMAKQEG